LLTVSFADVRAILKLNTMIALFVSGASSNASASLYSSSNASAVIFTSGRAGLGNISTLMPGPYFADVSSASISVYKAYRTYADEANSFYYGVIPDSRGTYQVASTSSPMTDGRATIAVPSRLYYPPESAKKPLSGVRVGVKDLFNLAGLKTSMGNRAWFRFYPPVDETATCIQYLVDLGAVIVGKTRMSQFANGEAPTAAWVDNHDPFNARGDGYQDPSSSSSGAGSAESYYDWVDMNIGSDTGGSVRAPAAVSGVFGNRPSQYIMTLEGALPMSPEMDTPAFVARTAAQFASWGKAWYSHGNASLQSYTSFPQRLIYAIDTPGLNTTLVPSPGFFPVASDAAQAIYDEFIEGLENFLGVQKEEFDFYTAYKNTSGIDEYPLDQLGSVWGILTTYEQYREFFADFVANYSAANSGDTPYVDPPVQFNMEYGKNLTAATHAEALANKTLFQNWLETQLLTPMPNTDYCSSSLLIHPISPGSPSYRDTYPIESPSEAGTWFGWNQYSISQLGGVPEVVLPIGQVNYTSRVSGTTKWLPVAVSVNAAAGCDLMLFDLVEKLAGSGVIPGGVKTGEMTF
jgi:Asp-tRNA(Asn)/Glu-tRNA(Gln) amidotransferase A subunit family amidase